jgi:hypothetical protein
MSDGHDRDSAKTKVLVDNTAQTVHKNLTKLFQEKPLFKIRWIWELLQNARDVAAAHGVRVSIVREQAHLSFRHDGEPFTNENVAHLIYHGSGGKIQKIKYLPYLPLAQSGLFPR